MSGEGEFGVDESDGRVLLDVHAVPGSKREGVAGVHGGALKVMVRAAAEKGKANAALVKVIARAAGVAPSSVAVVSGRTSRRKRVRVAGVSAADLVARIQIALAGAR